MARLVILLSVMLAAVASVGRAQSFFDSPCTSRIRRDWRQLSANEKELYRDAIKAAMTTGYHTLFQEVLSDKDTCNEVYLTGASVYWHRRFLLAYENMLRSLEPRFTCITIPYWDMFADFASQVALPTQCASMEQCSQFLGEFGGSSGTTVNVAINGLNISTLNPNGNCVNGLLSRGRNATESSLNFADFSSFCQSSAVNTSCSSCIPRGAWNSTVLPSSLTYTTLAKLIRSSNGFTNFGVTMQSGMQASMHNALNATMATCATAADPMFYSLQYVSLSSACSWRSVGQSLTLGACFTFQQSHVRPSAPDVLRLPDRA
jgi:tyrosinase